VRIGLISDPHANAAGLRAALDALDAAGAETVVSAGDAVGYHTAVNETIDELRARVEHVVLGNHDAMLLGRLPVDEVQRARYGLDYASAVITPENRAWLSSLPETLTLEMEGCTIAVFHGSPWSPLTEYVYPDADFARFAAVSPDVVVLGHTHHQLLRDAGTVRVVNPGSCGLPRDVRHGAAYALLDTRGAAVRLERVEFDETAVTSPFLDERR
jgi:putative phosphoesterase